MVKTQKRARTSAAKQIKPIASDSSLLKSHSKMRQWVEKNSLAALKLTIFDVLLEFSNKNKPSKSSDTAENLLIVDDLFEARVWNEVHRELKQR